jgi:hypothetical protein
LKIKNFQEKLQYLTNLTWDQLSKIIGTNVEDQIDEKIGTNKQRNKTKKSKDKVKQKMDEKGIQWQQEMSKRIENDGTKYREKFLNDPLATLPMGRFLYHEYVQYLTAQNEQEMLKGILYMAVTAHIYFLSLFDKQFKMNQYDN